jgi:hypothetical protein
MRLFILAGMVAALLMSGHSNKGYAEENRFTGEKILIKEVIEASIGWALDKDTDLLFNSMGQDEDFFYFSPVCWRSVAARGR